MAENNHISMNPVAGQVMGGPHPENPYSEVKYPSFFRLWNRGSVVKQQTLDLDEDEFFTKNLAQYQAGVKQRAASVAKTTLPVQTEAITLPYQEAPLPKFNVLDEAKWNDKALSFLGNVHQAHKRLAQQYGMKDISAADRQQLDSLESALGAAQSPAEIEKINTQIDSVISRGLSAEQFAKYRSELDAAVAQYSNPMANKVELAITPDVFKTIGGTSKHREGGWYDADLYSDSMKKQWQANGLVIQVAKDKLNQVTPKLVFGKETGKKLAQYYIQSLNASMAIRQNKIGARAVVAVYVGGLFWVLLYKFNKYNERELFRQKSKFMYRVINDEAPISESQKKVWAKHNEWAKTYYD